MRFSSRALSLLCAAALILPIGASAATATLKLRDVLAIVQSNKKPLSFDIDMRGTFGKGSATLKMKGTQNGNMKSLSKAAADVTLVLDAKLDAKTSGHAEVHGILVDKTVYVRIDDLTLKGEWAEAASEAAPYLDRWFSFPVDPEEYERMMKEQNNGRKASLRDIEAFFNITKEQLRDGNKTRYTVTIPKNKQRRLLLKLLGRGNASYIRSTSLDFTLTVDAMQNVFDALTSSLEIKAKIEGESMKFAFTGKTNALKSPPRITAPAGSTPWEEFSEKQNEPRMGDARNAQRKSDVNTILNATYQYAIDNNGSLPPTLASARGAESMICTTGHDDCDGISLDILTGAYLVRIPVDPNLDYLDSPDSGYTIKEHADGRLTVAAPLAENDAAISVTR